MLYIKSDMTPKASIQVLSENFLSAVNEFRTAELQYEESVELRDFILEVWAEEAMGILEEISKNMVANHSDQERGSLIINMFNSKIVDTVEHGAFDNLVDYVLEIPKSLRKMLLLEGYMRTSLQNSVDPVVDNRNYQYIINDPTVELGYCFI